MRVKNQAQTIRRSIALSAKLLQEAEALAPPELKGNFNRLMTVALQQFAARQKERTFEEAMAQMAADPAIRKENTGILKEFKRAERDRLNDD
jgi:hypothetical protein